MNVFAPAEFDRIVIVSDEISDSGGAAAVALSSVRHLAARGVRTTVLLGRASAGFAAPEGVEIIALGGWKLTEAAGASEALAGLYDPGVYGAVRQWIARNDTPRTLYHLHNWHKALSPSVFRALRPVASRLAITAHDYFLVCPNGGYFNFRSGEVCGLRPMSASCAASNCDKRRFAHKAWRLARQGVRAALFPLPATPALLIAPHAGVMAFLERGGVRRDCIRILRNPVTPWLERRVDAEARTRILFVGRLERDKGVDLLAEAADRRGISLSIVGDGPLLEPLRRRFPRHDCLGWKSRAEVSEIAASARLVVCSTLWPETFCLTAFEAAASGIPVLMSRNALAADELAARDAGELFDPLDLDATGASLRRLLDDSERIAFMSRRAFAQRQELAPDPERFCDRMLAIYCELFARSARDLAPQRGRAQGGGILASRQAPFSGPFSPERK